MLISREILVCFILSLTCWAGYLLKMIQIFLASTSSVYLQPVPGDINLLFRFISHVLTLTPFLASCCSHACYIAYVHNVGITYVICILVCLWFIHTQKDEDKENLGQDGENAMTYFPQSGPGIPEYNYPYLGKEVQGNYLSPVIAVKFNNVKVSIWISWLKSFPYILTITFSKLCILYCTYIPLLSYQIVAC